MIYGVFYYIKKLKVKDFDNGDCYRYIFKEDRDYYILVLGECV